MKIIFIGSIEFSYHILKEINNCELELVKIITKKKSDYNSDFVDLSNFAKLNDIDYSYAKDINNKKIISLIKNLSPDLIICVGWSQLLSKEILNIPKFGVIGYHPSKLPYNRGRHPIIWSLVLGLKETASSFFLMDQNADTGEIISQEKIKILISDDARKLYDKIVIVAKKQIRNLIKDINRGPLKKIKQKKNKGNFLRKRNFNDGEIDWRMSGSNICNLVRALAKPYVGAHFIFNKKIIKVWKVKIVKESLKNIEPGKVYALKNSLPKIKCGHETIIIEDYTPRIKFKVGEYL